MWDLWVFVLSGLLGGLFYVLMWTKTTKELKDYNNVKRVFLGAVVGYVYFFLHSDYNFPNGVMAFVTGYMGTDFIEALIERFAPVKKEVEK
jgi:H+/Cl- antiporter ClcA